MRLDLKIEELTDEQKRNFVLCYIDDIPKTYNDYDEETKAMMETPEYLEYKRLKDIWYKEWFKEHHSMSSDDMFNWDIEHGYNYKYSYKDYPEPDYVAGYTHYFYFTNNLSKQWGDDWDDAPYEHNAEIPYDNETDIIRIPVRIEYTAINNFLNDDEVEKQPDDSPEWEIKYNNYSKADLKTPKDYGYYNSPFSVDMINAKAIPWLWFNIWQYKKVQIENSVAIFGGDTIQETLNKIDKINKLLETKLIDIN
ncbi:hypothetical protein J6O48_03095 [bacterium]|nr:hypothetical protein [bacterium]